MEPRGRDNFGCVSFLADFIIKFVVVFHVELLWVSCFDKCSFDVKIFHLSLSTQLREKLREGLTFLVQKSIRVASPRVLSLFFDVLVGPDSIRWEQNTARRRRKKSIQSIPPDTSVENREKHKKHVFDFNTRLSPSRRERKRSRSQSSKIDFPSFVIWFCDLK